MKYDFIEIGTSDFETLIQDGSKGRGICVEPLSFYLDNLPSSQDVLKINVAISDKNEFKKIFWVSPIDIEYYKLPDWIRGCNKLDSPHPTVMRILENSSLQWIMKDSSVECITFQTFCERYNITEISHLKIDAEGHDIRIIKSMIEYGKVLPQLLTFEYNRELNDDVSLNLILQRLEMKGYRVAYRGASDITLEKRPKILVLSFYNENYRKMANDTIFDNFRKYCTIQGYDLICENITDQNFEREPQWFKIQLLLKNLKTGYDWLFFMDCDSLFMDFTQKIEDWIDPKYDMILPSHSFCDDLVKTNEGLISSQWLIKDSDTSQALLREIWESIDVKPEEIDTFDHEQRQMRISFMKPHYRERVKYIGDKSFNSSWYVNNPHMHFTFPTMNKRVWEPGDFIIHLTGYPTEPRTQLINQMSSFAGGKLVSWNRQGGQIFFRSLEDLKEVRIMLLDPYKNEIVNWDFSEIANSITYFIMVDEKIDLREYVFVCESKGEKISLHTFI